MKTLFIIIASVLLVQVSWTRDEKDFITSTENRQGRQYLFPAPLKAQFYNSPWPSYGYYPLYSGAVQPHFTPYGYSAEGEARIPESKTSDNQQAYSRQSLLSFLANRPSFFTSNPANIVAVNSSGNPLSFLFNSTSSFRPIFPINSNSDNRLRRYTTCTALNGLSGICIPALGCNRLGGQSSGFCSLGLTCCVNTVTKCGSQVTLNNTFWQPPVAVSSDSTCSLTIKMDNDLDEQFEKPICQIRLDFLALNIAQPDATSLCSTDSFVVGGATNKIPRICGDNAGQHMYLTVPPAPTFLQLLFTFGQSAIVRSWNIKITMLPCGVNYLAPPGCLQYFTQATGIVKSFNWKDVNTASGTRQLGNQDYSVCFRNELVSNQTAIRMCYSPCAVVSSGNSFFLSTPAAGTGPSLVGSGSCPSDFLMIQNSADSKNAAAVADRYCGQQFSPTANSATSAIACTTVSSFSIYYRTDGTEAATELNNSGFCFNFQELAV